MSKYKAIGKYINLCIIFGGLFVLSTLVADAQMPASTNYELQSYSFGAGGTASSSSESFGLFGIAGEIATASQSSDNFTAQSGLTYLIPTNIPTLTLTNTGSNYDRLQLVIGTANNPSDTVYAVQVSTNSSFTSDVSYVKADNTLGPDLETSDFRTYTSWGSGTGIAITGLASNTTYYVRAKAQNGWYAETAWGPIAAAATVAPSLTFSIDQGTLTFNNLNSGNSYTDSGKATTITTSTNAYNGYIVNARTTGPLTADSETIPNYSGTNSSPTTWAGYGFGYTTNDNNLIGGTADRFTNGGPKYAGFTTSSPGDPVADHAGPVTSPIVDEQFTIGYRVTANPEQAPGNYETTVLYIVVPEY